VSEEAYIEVHPPRAAVEAAGDAVTEVLAPANASQEKPVTFRTAEGAPILDDDHAATAAHFLSWRQRTNLIHFNDGWFDYSDGAYCDVDPGSLDAEIRMFLSVAKRREKVKVGAGANATFETRLVPYKANNTSVAEVKSMVRGLAHADRNNAAPPCWIRGADGPPPDEIVAFPNGLLHVPTGGWCASTPGFFTTNVLDFAYDPEAPAPKRWLRLLKEYWPDEDEQDIVDALQEFFGYVLVPSRKFHVIPVLHGPPRCGKGTILRRLRRLVGAANVTSPSFKSLGGDFGLQPLLYKLLAILSDMKFGKSTDVQTVLEHLQRISGGDAVSVNRKNQSAWEGFLAVRFIVAVNPPFSIGTDHTGGLISRLLCLPMEHSFIKRVDTTIEEELDAELPGILLWALEGSRRLHARGRFVEPKKGQVLKSLLMKNASPVAAFVMDDCALDPLAETTKDDLYEAYHEWCQREGRTVLGKEMFGRALLSTQHDKVTGSRSRLFGHRVQVYRGIRVECARRKPRRQRADDDKMPF
jgi:putative DNA primase/helicase